MKSFDAISGNSMWKTRGRGQFEWHLIGCSRTNRNRVSRKILFSFRWKEQLESHKRVDPWRADHFLEKIFLSSPARWKRWGITEKHFWS